MKNIDWIIHYVQDTDVPYSCNAHTHGMDKYNHPDFQVVLNLGFMEVGRILNEFGLRVQSGERFTDGQLVSGIYDDCSVMLKTYRETGRNVLRVIKPCSCRTRGLCRNSWFRRKKLQ